MLGARYPMYWVADCPNIERGPLCATADYRALGEYRLPNTDGAYLCPKRGQSPTLLYSMTKSQGAARKGRQIIPEPYR
jgi:hypothetical protein